MDNKAFLDWYNKAQEASKGKGAVGDITVWHNLKKDAEEANKLRELSLRIQPWNSPLLRLCGEPRRLTALRKDMSDLRQRNRNQSYLVQKGYWG